MKRNAKKVEREQRALGRSRLRAGRAASIFVVAACCTLGLVVRGYTRRSVETTVSIESSTGGQAPLVKASSLLSRLRLQPRADELRRRLGQRFSDSSLGVSVLEGSLTMGNKTAPIRIVRGQDGEGEQVSMTIGGEPAPLSWNSDEGVKAGASAITAEQRTIMERLALDSPDQFIFAQLRGAAYNVIAENVRPAEAGGSDDYDGPVWDMVRVVESTSRSKNRPQSVWRIYYINSSTGLLDKILSREGHDDVIAVLSSWVNEGGEVLPARIRWMKNKEAVMELTISNISLSAR